MLVDGCLWGAGNELSQAELIKRAFAGDDVQAEFDAAKAAEVEEELPKEVRPEQLWMHPSHADVVKIVYSQQVFVPQYKTLYPSQTLHVLFAAVYKSFVGTLFSHLPLLSCRLEMVVDRIWMHQSD